MSKVIQLPPLNERDHALLVEKLLHARVKIDQASKIVVHGDLRILLDDIWNKLNEIDVAIKLGLKEVTIG